MVQLHALVHVRYEVKLPLVVLNEYTKSLKVLVGVVALVHE